MRATLGKLGGLLVAWLSCTGGAAAQQSPDEIDPGRVSAGRVTLTGNGCTAWSGHIYQRENGVLFLVPDYRFVFAIRGGPSTVDCVMHVDLAVPEGRTVAVSKLRFEGTARVEDYGVLDFRAGVAWQGRPPTVPASRTLLREKFEGDVKWEDDLAGRTAALDFRPCDGSNPSLDVHLSSTLNRAADARAGLTVLHSYRVELDFAYQDCPKQ